MGEKCGFGAGGSGKILILYELLEIIHSVWFARFS
jgi:hypothetical protein